MTNLHLGGSISCSVVTVWGLSTLHKTQQHKRDTANKLNIKCMEITKLRNKQLHRVKTIQETMHKSQTTLQQKHYSWITGYFWLVVQRRGPTCSTHPRVRKSCMYLDNPVQIMNFTCYKAFLCACAAQRSSDSYCC